jgi:microcystin-dependent protein
LDAKAIASGENNMKRLLAMCGAVLMTVGLAVASQPLFQGQYSITGITGDTNTGWRLIGTFDDASLLGWGAADAATNDLIYCYSSYGDLDLFKVTNIVSVAGINLTVDVIYNETGVPRAGAPQAGYQIMCRPGYDGVASFIPSLTFGQFSEYLQNGARNLNLKYAIAVAATNGVTSISVTGAVKGAITFQGVGVTQTGAVFNFSGGGGAGTITNMSPDAATSIVWTASGGPQPIGSVTAYVAGVVVGYGTTGQVITLQEATNALNTRTLNLETATNALNTSVTNLNNATNSLNSSVTNLNNATNNLNGRVVEIEGRTNVWNTGATDASSATGNVVLLQSATNSLNTRAGNLENATNALNTRASNLETATSTLNTKATALEGATGSLNTAVGNLNNATNSININYYPRSNPSNFVTSGQSEPLWVAASNQVQTDIAGLKGATGSYYQASNPDGFVAGLLKSGNTATTQGKVYQQLTDGTWQMTHNTNVAFCNKAIGIAYGTNSSSAGMVVLGSITVTNNNLVIGSNLYVGATAGEWTQTTPSANGSVIRAIGYAKNTNEIYITPSPVWVEIGDLINANVNFNTYDATNIGTLAVTALQVTGLSGNGVVPVGAVQMYVAVTAPAGWLLCDGAAVATNTYPALFAVISTNFGSTNAAWFNVPDMRGVFPKGAGATTRAAGVDAKTNAYSAVLGAYYQDKIQGHRHNVSRQVANALGGTGANFLIADLTSTQWETQSPISDTVNGTPRTGASTEPQSLGVIFIIKY